MRDGAGTHQGGGCPGSRGSSQQGRISRRVAGGGEKVGKRWRQRCPWGLGGLENSGCFLGETQNKGGDRTVFPWPSPDPSSHSCSRPLVPQLPPEPTEGQALQCGDCSQAGWAACEGCGGVRVGSGVGEGKGDREEFGGAHTEESPGWWRWPHGRTRGVRPVRPSAPHRQDHQARSWQPRRGEEGDWSLWQLLRSPSGGSDSTESACMQVIRV